MGRKGGNMASSNYKSRTRKICLWCKKEYLGLIAQKYCSDRCAYEKHYSGRKKNDRGRIKKICVNCKKGYLGIHNQLYCSQKCLNENFGIKRNWEGISTGTVGAIQELRVSVDLLSKGYEVFRALSPSCSCDLLVKKNNKFFSIEVRTAYQNKAGRIVTVRTNIKAEYLALALPSKIIYEPKL